LEGTLVRGFPRSSSPPPDLHSRSAA
jgi:hypothetical protein